MIKFINDKEDLDTNQDNFSYINFVSFPSEYCYRAPVSKVSS